MCGLKILSLHNLGLVVGLLAFNSADLISNHAEVDSFYSVKNEYN